MNKTDSNCQLNVEWLFFSLSFSLRISSFIDKAYEIIVYARALHTYSVYTATCMYLY